jgi:hypothetical protein
MKKIAIYILLALVLNLGLTMVNISFAADDQPSTDLLNTTFNVRTNLTLDGGEQKANYFDPSDGQSPIEKIIIRLIEYLTRIIGTIAFILLVAGGFIFMTSQGSQPQIDKGKDIIKYAIIGLIVTFMAFIITLFIQSLFVTDITP